MKEQCFNCYEFTEEGTECECGEYMPTVEDLIEDELIDEMIEEDYS